MSYSTFSVDEGNAQNNNSEGQPHIGYQGKNFNPSFRGRGRGDFNPSFRGRGEYRGRGDFDPSFRGRGDFRGRGGRGGFGEAHIIQNQVLHNLDPIDMNRETPPYKDHMRTSKKTFPAFLDKLLKDLGLDEYTRIKIVEDAGYIQNLTIALTDKSADAVNNLELLETIGDTAFHHSVTRFIAARFPMLRHFNDPESVISNIRTCLEKLSIMSHILYEQGFTPYIHCNEDELRDYFEKVLEDCFEAFYGCLELIIDTIHGDDSGKGYVFIEKITRDLYSKKFKKELEKMDEILSRGEPKELYLRVETRIKILKEIFSANERLIEYDKYSSFDKYIDFAEPVLLKGEDGEEVYHCKCRILLHILAADQNPNPDLEYSVALTKTQAKNKAADEAIKYLASIGIGYPKKDKEKEEGKRKNKRSEEHCRPSAYRGYGESSRHGSDDES